MRETSKALLNLSITMQMQIRKNLKVRKRKIPKKHLLLNKNPKQMDLILDASAAGLLTIFQEIVNSFHTNVPNVISPAIQKRNAWVQQAKSNAATNVTFPVTQENNDSTSEQLPAMKLWLERDSQKFEIFGIQDCACIYTSSNASFAASMNLPVTPATNYRMTNALFIWYT